MVSGYHPHIPRPKIQPGGETHLRQPQQPQVPDIEQEPMKYIALALVHLRNEFSRLPAMIEDRSKPVDVYQPQTLGPESNMSITLQPQWEDPEFIESVLITGPAAATGTIQLGDRIWPFVIPASQILFIGAPLGICLSRSDARILTAAVAGEYTFELMGHADTRGNLI